MSTNQTETSPSTIPSSTNYLSSTSTTNDTTNDTNNNSDRGGGLLSLVATPARGSLWQHSIQSSSKRQREKICLDTLDGEQSNDANDEDKDKDNKDKDNGIETAKRKRVANGSIDNMMMKDSESRTSSIKRNRPFHHS